MKLRRFILTLAIFCAGATMLPAVEMFTHFDDGQRMGFESLNAVKKNYPGYKLPNGQRMPVAAPYWYPANGSHPWNWHAASKPMIGLPLHGSAASADVQPHNPYTKLPLPALKEATPLPARIIGQPGTP
jgi:hypothetical protein